MDCPYSRGGCNAWPTNSTRRDSPRSTVLPTGWQGSWSWLGIRLAPSIVAERTIGAIGGMRHTSAIRYSHDDPHSIVEGDGM
jgi:hypothetical protein